ncbi:hypothetical protein C0Q70_06317 [Pomacea canaliculata]|uniref:Alpha-galactosidase n=1 Tax=Pomacea canaliculata TaxID=400727 RepID=A0A2T7PNN4_POMCA|nr:alpha-N-acetylgalactosaminidase-like [Pomacea canaliculata]XP_025088518.1 alpha-N-acetylgalactosaminidase-like [Pomacea canaliculata]PVD35036.1 hypothetical protein C0Q70_06317 [Pomacea canaliculata]
MLLLVLLAVSLSPSHSLDNGLALTPPMGWLAWERFRCVTDCKTFPDSCISEKLFKDMADRLVADGYRDVGYKYVNIDDCWLAKQRDNVTGKLMPDPDRFPSGMKNLSDYMHKRGLMLGIYEDFGHSTCAGYPGSEFYMELDAQTFAEWEVDMVKFDGCNSDTSDMAYGFPAMGFFMNKTGRNMLYSCEWPLYVEVASHQKVDYGAIRKTCNMWRNYEDVTDSWASVISIIDYYGDNHDGFSYYSGPGGWADPDMLVVGDFGLSYYQQKAQMAMWAMLASPLFMSVDLRTIDPMAKALLQNINVIAINQDPLGIQAVRLFEVPGSISVWLKALQKGNLALAFLNKDDQGTPTVFTTSFKDLGLTNQNGYNVTEVFDNKFMGSFSLSQNISLSVDPTSVVLVRLAPL